MKNMLCYKKLALCVGAAVILTVVAVILFLVAGNNEAKQGADSFAETAYTTSYDSVSISYLSDMMGFKATDSFKSDAPEAVAYIDTTIRTSAPTEESPDLDGNLFNSFAITLSGKSGETACKLYYDDLYQKAYLQKDGDLFFETGEDFGRYIDSLFENTGMDFKIGKDDAALFKKYGWTLDYQISNMKMKLGDISTLSTFDPNAYYFAYHNALSKDVGLDMSAYSNDNVDISIYRIHESMPQEFYPTHNCRGIVVKNGDKTIGAFISAGRHDTFIACSLKGNSFEEVTGETAQAWLAENVQAEAAEKKMSRFEPEQIIETYINAINDQDVEAAERCLAKETLLQNLSVNMSNRELYQDDAWLPLTDSEPGVASPFVNLKSAKLLKVEPSDRGDGFIVTVEMQYKKVVTTESGTQTWHCTMVNESPETGWKIVEFGQG